MSCVTTNQFAILINGVATDFFSSSRGLRQGCPLSPYLFLLVAKGLDRLIKGVVGHQEFQGILVGKTLSLTHLLFVDDVLLFCYSDEINLGKLLELIDSFCANTRMEVKCNKLACYYKYINRALFHNMETFCPLEKLEIGEGLKYLGFLIKPNNYLKADWTWNIVTIESKINSWCNIWLSKGGRLVLIKYVLEAMPVYWALLAKISKGIIYKIKRLCSKFL